MPKRTSLLFVASLANRRDEASHQTGIMRTGIAGGLFRAGYRHLLCFRPLVQYIWHCVLVQACVDR